MSEVAIAEASPAPEAPAINDDEAIAAAPNPLSTDPEAGDKPAAPADKAAPEKPLTARESLERAAAKVDKAEKDATPADKAKAVESAGAQKDPVTGKFTSAAKPDAEAKPAAPTPADAPTRFSTDAKAAWATAPEPVKAEVHRAIRELEQGVQKYRGDAENYGQFKEFHELAKSVNVEPVKALREYVTIDKMLGENFDAGIARIFQNKGIDPRQWAAHVLGQPGQQPAPTPANAENAQLRQQIARLEQRLGGTEQQLGGVTHTLTSQRQAEVESQINAFKADPNHPGFDELSEQIAAHIANDGLSLADAYARAHENFQAMAQRLGLIPQGQASRPEALDLAAQTLKGQKSIAGAPSAGSAPATQKPSSSIKDALKRAIAAAG